MTKKVEYGLIALAYIGDNGGRPVSAREVAEKNAIPLSLTANVLKLLAKGRVVATRRGASGGYTLDRDLGHIRLQDVMAAVEGPVRLTPCCENGRGDCELAGTCVIQPAIARLNALLVSNIAGLTLRDFLALGRATV
jgi:Rrf2 family protein